MTLISGFICWSLAEYFVHRFVLHRFKPFRRGHMLHHRDPAAKVGVPYPVAAVIGCALFVAAAAARGVPGVVFAAGALLGYAAYVVLHEGLHRWRRLPRALEPLRRWHDLHHRGFAANYGVTSPLWDVAFGTFQNQGNDGDD